MVAPCDACQIEPPKGRVKEASAVVGLLLFCPCHLPVTIAGFVALAAAMGVSAGAAWLRPTLYGVYGAAFLVLIVLLVQMAARRRAFEREHEGGWRGRSGASRTRRCGCRKAAGAGRGLGLFHRWNSRFLAR